MTCSSIGWTGRWDPPALIHTRRGRIALPNRQNSLNPRGDFREEKTVFSRFLAQDPRVEEVMATPRISDMQDRMAAMYCVALTIPGRVIGILCAGTLNPDGFQAGIQLALDLLAPQLALLIENARLSRPSKDLAAASQYPAEPIPRDSRSAPLENLLARLAHDIKNPLTAISTFMQLFPTRWNDDHFRSTFYPVALEETERLLCLVHDMLDRGKKQSARLMPVDMTGPGGKPGGSAGTPGRAAAS